MVSPYESPSGLLEKSKELSPSLPEREDDFWQGLSEENVFSDLSPGDLKVQANLLINNLQKLSTEETPSQPILPTVPFTARQNCVLFCRVYGIHFLKSAPPPIPVVDAEDVYSEVRKFGAQFFVRTSRPLVKSVLR
ncbi:hypothetical protein GP486_001967 [Trichoglossum hirsutum]|uniref:Uncharacterized protein n=1 Tax=Trichoglossum hirsutum TaxID=265104 RepID=A0A9P8RS74_9PEZI|nr:hypothetical protein GP486_001967 [Trichoglossum hirsutum]